MHFHRSASRDKYNTISHKSMKKTKTHPALMVHYRCLLVESGHWEWWTDPLNLDGGKCDSLQCPA
jgi:hypothetical protein